MTLFKVRGLDKKDEDERDGAGEGDVGGRGGWRRHRQLPDWRVTKWKNVTSVGEFIDQYVKYRHR